MNNFTRARNPRPEPTPCPDPYRFLNDLPRGLWKITEDLFHMACRDCWADPEELTAWVTRDINSRLNDMRVNGSENLYYGRDELVTVLSALQAFPQEATDYADLILNREINIKTWRAMDESPEYFQPEGGAQ